MSTTSTICTLSPSTHISTNNKIIKIEYFDYQNIVTLNQHVTGKRYLIFDLWEDTRNSNNLNSNNIKNSNNVKNFNNSIVNNKYDQQYKQIFLQINDLKVLNIKEGQVHFDLSKREDVIKSMFNIEEHILLILKKYLAKLDKKGNFNFCSVIKYDNPDNMSANNNMNTNNVALTLNLNNDDYDVGFYTREKQRTDMNILSRRDTSYNIIIEIMYIYFDMIKGVIVVDTRLRMVLENHVHPIRLQINNPDNFIQDDKHSEFTYKHDYQLSPSIHGIKQSFDVTKTEIFEDDRDSDDCPFLSTPISSQSLRQLQQSQQSHSQPQSQQSQQSQQPQSLHSTINHTKSFESNQEVDNSKKEMTVQKQNKNYYNSNVFQISNDVRTIDHNKSRLPLISKDIKTNLNSKEFMIPLVSSDTKPSLNSLRSGIPLDIVNDTTKSQTNACNDPLLQPTSHTSLISTKSEKNNNQYNQNSHINDPLYNMLNDNVKNPQVKKQTISVSSNITNNNTQTQQQSQSQSQPQSQSQLYTQSKSQTHPKLIIPNNVQSQIQSQFNTSTINTNTYNDVNKKIENNKQNEQNRQNNSYQQFDYSNDTSSSSIYADESDFIVTDKIIGSYQYLSQLVNDETSDNNIVNDTDDDTNDMNVNFDSDIEIDVDTDINDDIDANDYIDDSNDSNDSDDNVVIIKTMNKNDDNIIDINAMDNIDIDSDIDVDSNDVDSNDVYVNDVYVNDVDSEDDNNDDLLRTLNKVHQQQIKRENDTNMIHKNKSNHDNWSNNEMHNNKQNNQTYKKQQDVNQNDQQNNKKQNQKTHDQQNNKKQNQKTNIRTTCPTIVKKCNRTNKSNTKNDVINLNCDNNETSDDNYNEAVDVIKNLIRKHN